MNLTAQSPGVTPTAATTPTPMPTAVPSASVVVPLSPAAESWASPTGVAALGTVAAVLVALWLGLRESVRRRRDERARAEAEARRFFAVLRFDAQDWDRERDKDGNVTEIFRLKATVHNKSARTFLDVRVIIKGEGITTPRVTPFGQFWPDREQPIKPEARMPERTVDRLYAGENLWDVELLFVDEDNTHWYRRADYRVERIDARRRAEILKQHGVAEDAG